MNETTTLSYDFIAPQHITFGWGRRCELGRLARSLGRRGLVICGAPALLERGVMAEVAEMLSAEGIASVLAETIVHEPEVEDVDRVAALFRQQGAGPGDFVLAVGGGAAIDLGKAAAAMATNRQSPTVRDYLEGVGKDLKLTADPLPVLAMPTTAGTGAEATKNAVISSYDPPFKKSLRDDRIMPRIALVDPQLSVSVPPAVTAASGMDAITQLVESYISRKAKPIPQALAKQGLKLALPAIAEAVRDGTSRSARERMSHAAMLSGMALANSGLGMAHGVAPALGVHCRVPHGVACALMLPVALRVNREVRKAELAELAHLLIGRGPSSTPDSAIDALIETIEGLCDEVGTPRRLSQVGVRPEQFPQIVESSRGSSMSGNPRELSNAELTRILEEIL
jgi:alcohol dehydrogenase class IV